MSTTKDLSALVARYEAKAIANPTKAAIYQAKVDAKIAALIAKGKTVVIDGVSGVTSYDLDTGSGSSGGGGSSGSGTTGTTYTLTTSLNAETGTANNDTFSGVIGSSLGATDGTTLNPGDNLSGGAGNDTLTVAISGTHAAAVTVNAVTLNSVETISLLNFEASGNLTTIDLAVAPGVTAIRQLASGDNGDTAFTSVRGLVDAEMANGSGDLSLTYLNTVLAGSADTQNLTLSGVTAGTFTAAPTTGTEGVETIAITSSGGTRNVLTAITDNADTTTITVAGDTALTVGTIGASVTSFNAAANTGGVTATLSATATAAIVGSSGNDSFTSGTVLSTGSVAAGDGTDTLVTTDDTVVATSTLGARYTGFETLSVSTTAATSADRAQDMSLVAGLTAANITVVDNTDSNATFVQTATLTNLSANLNTLNITGLSTAETGGNDDLTVTVVATRAANTTADSMTVNLGTSTAASGATAVAVAAGVQVILDVNLANEETITINSLGGTGRANFVDDLTNTSATSMTFTGAAALTVDSMTSTVVTSINASAMTGAFIMATANAGAVASTISGGSGNDSLIGGSAADNISGNNGNDSITAAGGNDVVAGGAGNDTIVGGAGVDNLAGADGDDTFNVTTTTDFIGLSAAETVSGGAGNDNLVFSQAATTITLAASDLTGLSSIDRVTINGTTGAGSITLTDAVYTSNGVSELRIIDGDLTQGTLTVAGGALTGTNAVHVTANTATGVNDTLTGGAGNDTFVFSTTTGLEATDTVVGGAGTDTISLTATAAVTANLTGVRTVERIVTTGNGGDVSITVGSDDVLAASTTLTVDASSITNSAFDLLYNGAGITTATKSQNVTGTAGTDTITGGSGNDVVSAGDSADTVTGGAGIDNLSGGTGDDRFVVATAAHFTGLNSAETVSGGSGTDTLAFSVGAANIAIASADLLKLSSIETIAITNADTQTASLVLSDEVFTANGATTINIVNAITAGTDDGISVSGSSLSAANSIAFTGASAAAANESAVGGAGNDTFTFTTFGLDGAAAGGDDVATAYDANDTINGGSGNDLLTINTGETALTAATLTNVSNIERIVVSGTTGGVGLLTLADGNFASVTGASISATSLTTGALLVTAAAEDDSTFTITGGSGADSIIGGQLADTIVGGAGADTIQGGLLADSLTGNSGADVFEFTAVAQSSGSNADSITDFESGTDKLNVTLNYNTAITGLTIDATVQTARAGTTLIQDNLSGARGQAVYDTVGNALYVNVNGDNLITTSDYKIGINPAATATASIVEGDINFVITGGSASDTITAGGGADTITGGGGGDSITGGAGADSITVAAAGADTIEAGAGNDSIALTGAGAIDTIKVTAGAAATLAAVSTANGTDTVTGLTVNVDLLDFSAIAAVTNGTTTQYTAITTATNAAIAAGDNVIILDDSVGAVRAADATALAGLTTAFTNVTTGNVVVVYAAADNGAARVALATLTAGDISAAVDLMVLTGIDVDNLTAGNFVLA